MKSNDVVSHPTGNVSTASHPHHGPEPSQTRIRCDRGPDDPETHVSRVPLAVDEKGWTEITALLSATLEAVLRTHAEAPAARQSRARTPRR